MKERIYAHLLEAKKKQEKLLALLLDPDKVSLGEIPRLMKQIHLAEVDLLLVGGSTVELGFTEKLIEKIKVLSQIPIILFPGDYTQITNHADAILFLSLLSGRNPEYLIEQQMKAVPMLEKCDFEIIPTGYILIDGGHESAVQRVSKTLPIPQNQIEKIVHTAKAAMYLGNKLIYLEAGSGAINSVDKRIVKEVSTRVDIPVIVGGGIKNKSQLQEAYENGADVVVIGTAFENDQNVLQELSHKKDESIH
ncbi:geranylgeranylglyceryl/heptaprenylglyceryl phosphate synthase [Namhaeicola litoreus]|uniref:Geranylgeranylglyceryl phosphate synthase n=1 Tax=Namhaeicola litoreus TaxID=1052145 RepID=A0ABW3Y409_9FLAO